MLVSVQKNKKSTQLSHFGWENRELDEQQLFNAIMDGHAIGNPLGTDGNVKEWRIIAVDTFGKSLAYCQINDVLCNAFAWVNIGPQHYRHFFILETPMPTERAVAAIGESIQTYLTLFKAQVVAGSRWLTAQNAFFGGEQKLLTSDTLDMLGTWDNWTDEDGEAQPEQTTFQPYGQIRKNAEVAYFNALNFMKWRAEGIDEAAKAVILYGCNAFGPETTKEMLCQLLPKSFDEQGEYDWDAFFANHASYFSLVDWAYRKSVKRNASRSLAEKLAAFSYEGEEYIQNYIRAMRRWDDLRRDGVVSIADVTTHTVNCRFLVEAKPVFDAISKVSPRKPKQFSKSVYAVENHDFPSNDGNTCIVIRSPMHTAKSVLIRQYRAENKSLKFMFVSPRISLCAKDTKQLNATPYRPIVQIQNPDRKTLTVVLNSLTVKMVDEFDADVIVLDEVVQILEDIFHSGTMDLPTRAEVARALAKALAKAKMIITADADATQRVCNIIKTLAPNANTTFHYIENIFKVQRGEAIKLSSKEILTLQLEKSVKQALEDGKTVQVYCASKGEAETIERHIRTTTPDAKRLLVTADTTGEDEQSQYLADPDQHMEKYHVVVASPTITSGISIESEVGDIFLIGTAGSIGVRHMRQQACRARKAKKLYWFVESTNMMPFRSEQAIYSAVLEGHQQIQQELLSTQAQSVGLKDTFARIYAATLQDIIVEHTEMCDLFDYMSQQDGWVKMTIDESELASQEDIKSMAEMRKEAKKQVKEEKQQAIVAAKDLTDEEYQALAKKDRLTRPQANALEKAHIKRFYLQTPDLELVKHDNNGRTRFSITSTEKSTRTKEQAQVIWAAALASGAEMPRFDNHDEYRAIYSRMVELMGFDPTKDTIPKYSASDEWVTRIGNEVETQAWFRDGWKRCFNATFRGTKDHIASVNSIFRALGMSPTTKNGDRVDCEGMARGRRAYTCDNTFIKTILERRAQALKGLPVYWLKTPEKLEDMLSRCDFKPEVKAQIRDFRKQNLQLIQNAVQGVSRDNDDGKIEGPISPEE